MAGGITDGEAQQQLDMAVSRIGLVVDVVFDAAGLQVTQVFQFVAIEQVAGRIAQFIASPGRGDQALVVGDQDHLAGTLVELLVGLA